MNCPYKVEIPTHKFSMRLISKLPITTKLLIILLLISILPLFIITYGFYSLEKVKLTEQAIHVLEVQSKNVAASINHFVDYKFKHLYKIASTPQLTHVLKNVKDRPLISQQSISSLRAKLRIDPDFLSFSLMDADGNVVLSTSDMATIDFGARPFFFEAMKGEKYVSPPSLDEGKPSIYFSIPVTHADKILGVLVAQCSAEELWELIETESERVGSGNAVILSNSDGMRIAHSTSRDLIFKSWVPLKPEVKEQILKEKRYGSDIKEIASTDKSEIMDAVTKALPPQYFQHGLAIGTGTYHSTIRVMDNGWRIISTVPESTFLEPVRTSIFYISIISGIIACLVIAASIIIGRLSTKRIKLLASISEEIIDGNFTKVVPFANGDEIGQLGKAFNTMTASIRDRIEQLKTLYQKGINVTKAKNLKAVVDEVLFSAMELTDTSAGSIILSRDSNVMIKSQKGLSNDFLKKLKEEDIPHFLLNNTDPLEFHNIEREPIFENTPLREEGIKSLFILPLRLCDNITGIIYLGKFETMEFTEKHRYLIKNFYTLAVESIEKQILLLDIEESLAYLQCTLDDSQDMIITTDSEGRVVKCSRGVERILGYQADEVIGSKVSEFYVNKNERSNILKALHEKEAIYNYETKLLKKDGSPVDISITISVLKDKSGNIIGTVGISKDITEEKRLREELKKKNKELEELTENLEDKVFERTKEFEQINKELSKANEMKGRFIANASHELRTPLHSIIGFSEILLQKTFGDLNEKQQRYTNTIYTSGKHLIHLVNNILDLAKIEAGKMELTYQTFSLKTTVDEVMMVLKPLAEKKRIEPKFEMSSEVDIFTADKIKFKQILYNLLSNAIKFTPEGGTVGINIEKVRGNKEILPWALELQRLLKVSVWDTGVGIRAEDREKIFEEFEQLDPSKSTEGTGLGLSLTKKLVELHGGQIDVGGTYGQGTVFNVYLPFVVHEKQATMPKPIFPPIAETRLKEECPLVLVVEDDIPTVEILTIHLTQAGYRVAHAYDGEEAILKAKELKPFVITLDIMLPKKDGWEVLQSIKADPETRDIPVIIHSIVENKELAFALGATDYLVKPVDKSILLEKLAEMSLLTKKARYPVNIIVITNDNTIRNNLYSILQNEGFVMQSATDAEEGINLALTTKANLMIIDLNIPEGGFKVIKEYRENPALRDIPIFAITSTDLSPDERLEVAGQIEMVLCKDAISSKEIVNHLRNIEILYPKKSRLIDDLTGVFNYRYFQIRLAQEIRRATRYNLSLVLLILDVDQFGHYVDKKGEYYGNLILKKIAEIVRKNIRGSDVLVRHGIDSFAIVLTNTFLSSGLILAKRFVSMIHDYPFLYEDVQPKGKITASIGASAFKEHTPEELIRSAELAVSSAITNGRNRVEVFQPQIIDT